MSIVIGIDVGGSTTKIVGFEKQNGTSRLIAPLLVHANDPVTSAYGAFGKFLDKNALSLSDIDEVLMTGVGSAFLKDNMYGLPLRTVPEFQSIGRGGMYLSGLDNCLVVSMGTGTAIVHATDGKHTEYLGGTGVGGGTLIGLSRLLMQVDTVEHIEALANEGDLSKIDLRISDITKSSAMPEMPADLTASNFGNVSDIASKEDVASGILNLVFETVGMCSIFAARSRGVRDIVLTGNLTRFERCRPKFAEFNRMYENVNFLIPRDAQFATVIGTALSGGR